MQQWIVETTVRCRYLPWPRRLPGSVAADRPRGDGCTILTRTCVLPRLPLPFGPRNLRDGSLSPVYFPWEFLRGLSPRHRRSQVQE